jgi:hypothetical protein
MPDYCPEHPNTEIVADEDTGIPICWVCVALQIVDRVDSFGITGADGQHREVTKTEFIESVLARA